jgi:hypothetical protein
MYMLVPAWTFAAAKDTDIPDPVMYCGAKNKSQVSSAKSFCTASESCRAKDPGKVNRAWRGVIF